MRTIDFITLLFENHQLEMIIKKPSGPQEMSKTP
jgi:hypothetical protein